MATAASRSTGIASRGNTTRCRSGTSSGVAATAAAPKNLGWIGARRRLDRWAAELRLPRTRARLWIGTFATPEQAALAYDAAIFCLYGARVPRSRRINFPTVPRPNIAEHIRVGLTVSNIRAIAENYARTHLVYLVPPPVKQLPAAVPPVPPMVEAVPVGAAAAGAGEVSTTTTTTTTTTDHGNMNAMDVDGGVSSIEEYFLAVDPEDFDNMIAADRSW